MKPSAEDLNNLLTETVADSLAELYHENSKLRPVNSRQYAEYISLITGIPHLAEKMAQPYKTYPTRSRIALPEHFDDPPALAPAIKDIIRLRRTLRQFSGRPISLADASRLLYFAYGITHRPSDEDSPVDKQFFRAVPSAGALYPLELYMVAWRVVPLEPGIYHYSVLNHGLELIEPGDFSELAGEYTMSQEITEKASALFLVSAVFRRSMVKYHERGYRFVLLEAGHLGQNICLMATAMNLGILPIGGFLDDELNQLVGLDGVNETVIYPLLAGTT
jgi:SagB-type dehydrogenase family enzyme